MAVFFTSDTHFGHASIIRSCQRPFASADEMDAALIARWNAAVGPRDTVWHLGDFCFRNDRPAPWYLERLHGEVHLIEGNHDLRTLKHHAACFASVRQIREISVEGRKIVLCHYPLREWNGCYHGAWHLHGHVHGRMNEDPVGHSMDAGVDCHEDYRPWRFEEVAAILGDRVSPFLPNRPAPLKRTIRAPSPPGSP
jgi:calcineurin-like phosphoesterase family protein